MARPTKKFLDALTSNSVWLGPRPGIIDLHVYQKRIPEGDLSLSCWELEPGEYQEVMRTGKVYLHVYGHHPPVWVSSAREVANMLNVPHGDEPSVLAKRINELRREELEEARAQARRDALIDAENAVRKLILGTPSCGWDDGVVDAAQIIADMQEATSEQEDAEVDS